MPSGRRPRWGEATSALTVRWPKSHRAAHEKRAAELGISFSEYVVRTMAEVGGLELGTDDSASSQLRFSA